MTVEASFSKLVDEVKKTLSTKQMHPSLANAFIGLIVAVFEWFKRLFFETYYFLFNMLNHFLPLPFLDKIIGPDPVKKEKQTNRNRPRTKREQGEGRSE